MAKKQKRFKDIWFNQTAIGKRFGISSIAVGKLFIANNLKDSATGKATEKALNDGFASFTPLKDGTPFYLWNIDKITPVLSKEKAPLSQVQFWVNEVKTYYKGLEKMMDEGNDKIAYMGMDCLYDEVPREILSEVKAILIAEYPDLAGW